MTLQSFWREKPLLLSTWANSQTGTLETSLFLPERVETFPDCATHETGTRVPTPQAPIQAAITLLGVRKTLSADVTAQWSAGKSTQKRCYLWSRKQRWEVETVCFSCHITTCREHSTYSAYSASVAFCCFLLLFVVSGKGKSHCQAQVRLILIGCQSPPGLPFVKDSSHNIYGQNF